MQGVDLLLLRLAGLRTALIVPTHVGASSGTLHTNAPADKGIDQKLIFSMYYQSIFFMINKQVELRLTMTSRRKNTLSKPE